MKGVVGAYPEDSIRSSRTGSSSTPWVRFVPSGCGTTSLVGTVTWTNYFGPWPDRHCSSRQVPCGRPRNSKKSSASQRLSRIILTVRARSTPRRVPIGAHHFRRFFPTRYAWFHIAASIFWARRPPFNPRCLGRGSMKRTFSPHGTTSCL